MTILDSAVPHRLGRRTSFIPALEGKAAQWADVMDVSTDVDRTPEVAEAATATVLLTGGDHRPSVTTADVGALAQLEPDRLLAVRRPVSHQGMRNYISRAVVPSELGPKAVWCESFNELSHLRDLLLTTRPTQVTTQPCRLEWVFSSGVRSHIPDFMLRYSDGRTLLVDVTTESKVEDPRLLAILRITRVTAESMGWTYEVRTELPAQRVRNINFIHAGRRDVRQDRVAATRLLRSASGSVDIQRASELLGGPPQGYARLWDLVAHGFVHLPLDEVLDTDTRVSFASVKGGASWRHSL